MPGREEQDAMERVVVTGVGAVSCVGNDAASFWEALKQGKSGIAPITAFDSAALSTHIAGEAKGFQFDTKMGKRMDRFAQFAMSSARQALVQGGLVPESGGEV
ncbi:MAG TPA: beta-ketoacyl synthase N-terminal-like domain-containing protein, partial [bacterium]